MKNEITSKWKGIYFYKNQWENDVCGIGIEQTSSFAGYLFMGIYKDPDKFKDKIGDGRIKAKLDEDFRQGKREKHWEWKVYLDPPYQNLNTEDGILMIYENLDQTVEYFANLLLKLKEITEKDIDDLLL